MPGVLTSVRQSAPTGYGLGGLGQTWESQIRRKIKDRWAPRLTCFTDTRLVGSGLVRSGHTPNLAFRHLSSLQQGCRGPGLTPWRVPRNGIQWPRPSSLFLFQVEDAGCGPASLAPKFVTEIAHYFHGYFPTIVLFLYWTGGEEPTAKCRKCQVKADISRVTKRLQSSQKYSVSSSQRTVYLQRKALTGESQTAQGSDVVRQKKIKKIPCFFGRSGFMIIKIFKKQQLENRWPVKETAF